MTKLIRKIPRILMYIIVLFVALITIFPLFSTIMASFKSNMEILTMPETILPQTWTLDNYVQAFSSDKFNLARMMFNSIWTSAAEVAIVVFISALCGYVFARGEFPGKKAIFMVFTSLMFISLGSITIYPKLTLLSTVGLNRSLWGLIVLKCFGIPVANMYIVRGFINALPKEIDEAATIDGCTFTGIFFRIILPLLVPALMTIGIMAFNGAWNEYIMPAIFTMTKPEQQTLMVGIMALKNSGESAVSWNILFAAASLSILPILIVFIAANKYITAGVTAGAVKG